ncbi:protein Mis18-beta isoform X3 [Chiloscyllium plagiosum]|uniref:protein Mis18-beta isoform X3 n=2 Tax=Chiloscyllium plagiosum TaxID=36176 RepID=UPI001CB8292C|nr:protein Mis18-beta isoform X3 [Chiloscyllium plagiosum]
MIKRGQRDGQGCAWVLEGEGLCDLPVQEMSHSIGRFSANLRQQLIIEHADVFDLYKSLYCSFCRSHVGIVPFSTTDSLDYLRGLYCLDKHALHCYMLQSNSQVKPAALNFQPPCLIQHIGELKRQIVVAHYRLLAAMNKLNELVGEESGQDTSVTAERQRY